MVVVDPGVGSARRPILAEAGGQYFIAPDNGVLSMIFDAAPHKVREISNPRFMAAGQPNVSRTRCFAPAAAHLAKGAKAAAFGKLIHDYVRARDCAAACGSARTAWRGTILKVDRFGNLITNFAAANFDGIRTRPFEMRAGGRSIDRLALTYAETAVGDYS